MAPNYRQDMPPTGGYGPIEYARKIQKPRISGYGMFGIFIGVTTFAWVRWVFTQKKIVRPNRLEENDAKVALEPFLLAERNRLFLTQLRKNRDDENEIMKDVPGWKTGTWMGEPLLANQAGRFPIISPEEYYAHTTPYELYDRMNEKRWH